MSTDTTTELYGTPYISPETSRGLTAGEINMLRTVFGDSIDYSSVKIYSNNNIVDTTALSVGGDVRFDSTDYKEDFSQATDKADKTWFVHEMTHVWQSQNGYDVFNNGLGLQVIKAFSDIDPYSYDLDPNKSFRDYNPEQQADIISDYYRHILLYDGSGDFTTQQNAVIAKLVGEFINSDKGGDWLPTLEATLQPWKDFAGELLENMPTGKFGEILGKKIGDLLAGLPDTINPQDILGGILDGLQAALPGGLLPWLFDLIPEDMNPFINVPWKEAMYLDFWISPLVLDLDGDGVETFGITSDKQVLFDHDGDGVRNGTGWVKSDDGLLVLDRNGNGVIDNGSELFGDQTTINGTKATNGFSALSSEDTNKDGKFDANDTNFSNVRVWRDIREAA